jgi:hypothetical protein
MDGTIYPIIKEMKLIRFLNIARLSLGIALSLVSVVGWADGTDPFSPKRVITSGPSKNLELDNDVNRSSRALTPDERRMFGITNLESYALANFSHDGKYWVAEIPYDALQDVIYQRIPFEPHPSTHSQFRFRLKPGSKIRLIEQIIETPRRETVLTEDIISTLHIARPMGQELKLPRVVIDAYGVTFSFGSTSQKLRHYFEEGDKIHQFEINFPDVLVHALFEERIGQATLTFCNTYTYKVFTRNCTTTLIDTLDAVLERPKSPKVVKFFQSYFPKEAIAAHGVELNRIPDYDKEIGPELCAALMKPLAAH